MNKIKDKLFLQNLQRELWGYINFQ